MSMRSKHNRQKRVARLHQTALEHIANNGVQGLRLNVIAKELGYTTAALYRYYPSKETLIVELQKITLNRMYHSLQQLLEMVVAESDVFRLLMGTHFYIEYNQRSPASFALNSSIFSNPSILLHGENRMQILILMEKLLQLIQDLLYNAGVQSSKRDLSQALCLWSSLHGVLLTQKYRNDFAVPQPNDFISTLLLGWGVPVVHLRQAQHELTLFHTTHPIHQYTSLDLLESS